MTASIYTRVSTDDQADRQKPLDDQLAECRDYCAAEGWEIVHEYSDPGISGTRWGRPQLQAMLRDAAKFDRVVVWSHDRIGRGAEVYYRARGTLTDAGTEIVAVSEPHLEGIALEAVVMVGGEQVRSTKRATIRALRRKTEAREYRGGPRPIGYQWIDDSPVPVPSEAALVRRVFELADPAGQARTYLAIARELGLRVPRVRTILGHPIYVGAYVSDRYYAHKDGLRPRRDWRIQWDNHEAIVPRALFDRVQVRLERREHGINATGRAAELALSGLLICGRCGRQMHIRSRYRKASGQMRSYYVCPSMYPAYWDTNDTARCPGVGAVQSDLLLCRIADRLLAEMGRTELVDLIIEGARQERAEQTDTRRLRRDLKSQDTACRNLIAAIASGKVTDTTTLADELERAQRFRDTLRRQLEDHRRRRPRLPSRAEVRANLERARLGLSAIMDSESDPDRALKPHLANLVESVTVAADGVSARVVTRWDAVLDLAETNAMGAHRGAFCKVFEVRVA